LPNGAFLPNSAHRSVSSLYQFLVLTNMHNSRIITSNQSKIVINSSRVYLSITRQHAQVGHKNINIFSYKNHLARFCIKGKQFI
jgi:hypothetical protein